MNAKSNCVYEAGQRLSVIRATICKALRAGSACSSNESVNFGDCTKSAFDRAGGFPPPGWSKYDDKYRCEFHSHSAGSQRWQLKDDGILKGRTSQSGSRQPPTHGIAEHRG